MKFSCGYSDDGVGHDCCKIVDKLKKEQKKNQELLDELVQEEKSGEFVSDEYKEQLDGTDRFFQEILELRKVS